MPILIKPFLYLIAFGPLAVLFASVFGLACWLLMVCVRVIRNYANLPRLHLRPPAIGHKSLKYQEQSVQRCLVFDQRRGAAISLPHAHPRSAQQLVRRSSDWAREQIADPALQNLVGR